MELPIINGRECIPLRLIRFITCERISPDTLLKHLCHEEGNEWQPLFAYHTDGNKIPPDAWRGVARMVQALSERPSLVDDEWIIESNNQLPPGFFIWFDEFTLYVKRCFVPAIEFNFSPVILDGLKPVFEGFDLLPGTIEVIKTDTSTGGKDTPDKKGGLQYAVENYLDRNTGGTWEGFKIFLDEKLNLSKQEVLFGKVKYRDFFKKTNKTGILLCDHKQGKTSADAGYNRYTVADIKAVIRKEKAKRLQK